MLLRFQNFSVRYGPRQVLRAANLEVAAGSWTVCLGPSGSGKSTLADAVCGLLPADAVTQGEMERPARRIARMWQEPRLSLSPLRTIGDQVADVARAHGGCLATAMDWLARLGLEGLAERYPWQLSSGQAQRAALARALAVGSPLLVADECTSSLDPETEMAVLAALAEVWRQQRFGILWFTHRPAAVAPYATDWWELSGGACQRLTGMPQAATALAGQRPWPQTAPLLQASGLGYAWGSREVLRDVHLTLTAGTTTALLGASGAGKSTLLRLLAGWEKLQRGCVQADGAVQLVPPDAATAVAPGWTVAEVAGEALVMRRRPAAERVAVIRRWLDRVGLTDVELHRPAAQLSGGQRRRLMLARALVAGAQVLLLYECLNGLDLALQRQLLGMLKALRDELGLALLWVTHDMHYLAEFADVVCELRDGVLQKVGDAA